MNTQTKSIIKGGLLGGVTYALVMVGFDFTDGENFNVWKFVFNSSFFGFFMGLMIRYNFKKKKKKTE
jgi:hypothetical protein|tara:strand:- start:1088 stop:1288 length:201 start_codon:yes stop_codon:yes gene_type:complete